MFLARNASYGSWLNLDHVGSLFITEDGTWQIQAYLTTDNGTPTSSGAPVVVKAGYSTEQEATDALDTILSAVGSVAVVAP